MSYQGAVWGVRHVDCKLDFAFGNVTAAFWVEW
jgi:hypothetical protein